MASEIPASLRGRMSFLLGSLYRRALDLEVQQLARIGVDVKQQAALAVLADEGPMTQRDLSERLGIDRTTMVAIVDRLEERDRLSRTRDPADRRAYLLTLTPTGRSTQNRGRQLVDQAQRELLAALNDQAQRALTELLARALG